MVVMTIRSAVNQGRGQSGRRGNGVLGSGQPGRRGRDRKPGGDHWQEQLTSKEPVAQEPHRHRRTRPPRSSAFKLGLTVSVLAALAILAGTAGLALTSATTTRNHRRPDARASGSASAPLKVVGVSPAPGKAGQSGTIPVLVSFDATVARDSTAPQLSPSVPGQWQASGSTFTFTPTVPLPPSTRFTLRIPAGNAGVRSAAGYVLVKAVTTHFRTAPYSQLRLTQLLSTLGFLPVSWQPAARNRLTSDPASGPVASQQEMAYSPPVGSFTWQRGYPEALRAQWRAGRPNVLVKGAVMAFKAQHHMPVTATTGKRFWAKLIAAAQAGQRNAFGYTYALASKAAPETLTIWHDGHVVLRSLANTGIPVAPTADGTFPVYLRYQFQIMRGTNPDGSRYADPVSYVAYFNGGDAVHYFPRGSYGFQQSLGCVELPYDAARQAWPYLTYGSLVTVTG